MSIRITKEKALSDVSRFKKSLNKDSYSKEEVFKILEDIKDEILHIDLSRAASNDPTIIDRVSNSKGPDKAFWIPKPEDDYNVCSNCQTEIPDFWFSKDNTNFKFCPNCGEKISNKFL